MGILRLFTYLLLTSSIPSTIFSSTLGVMGYGHSVPIGGSNLEPSYFFYQQAMYPRDCAELRNQCLGGAVNSSGVFVIQPQGFSEPFQVYCDNSFDLGGWTVIHRRGFGFLSSEFWIGNDKLAYLTNQAVYELHVDMMLSNGSSFYIKYDSFRISDEWSQYAVVSVGKYNGSASCPISDGESYVNLECSEKCTCLDGQLNCDSTYSCSPQAECRRLGDVAQCYCNEGYAGDWETCTPLFTDCYDAYQAGHTKDGVYTILPSGWPGSPFNVSCVMSTNGGGWTVFQRRIDGETDFYQNWTSYQYGFGSLDREFWLGNEQLHYLTNQKNYKLRIDLQASGGALTYAEYASFSVSDNNNKFRADSIGDFDGSTAANGMLSTNGRPFSTFDQDNDGCWKHACAAQHRGAWWHASYWCDSCKRNSCSNFPSTNGCFGECTYSNLNGDHSGGYGENIFWHDEFQCNIDYVEMKIRPS